MCTVLVYLNDVTQGGHTSFSKLGFKVLPQKGTALVFFPARLDGVLDDSYLHAAEPALDEKWVSQIWVRQNEYNGVPSIRTQFPIGGDTGANWLGMDDMRE